MFGLEEKWFLWWMEQKLKEEKVNLSELNGGGALKLCCRSRLYWMVELNTEDDARHIGHTTMISAPFAIVYCPQRQRTYTCLMGIIKEYIIGKSEKNKEEEDDEWWWRMMKGNGRKELQIINPFSQPVSPSPWNMKIIKMLFLMREREGEKLIKHINHETTLDRSELYSKLIWCRLTLLRLQFGLMIHCECGYIHFAFIDRSKLPFLFDRSVFLNFTKLKNKNSTAICELRQALDGYHFLSFMIFQNLFDRTSNWFAHLHIYH